MALKETRLDVRLDHVERELVDESVLHVVFTWAVYDRPPDNEEGEPLLIYEELDVEVIVDSTTGRRWLSTDVDPELFRDIARDCRRIDIRITVTPKQKEILEDDHKVVAMLCGNRSGKSEVCKWAMVRAWARLGGAGRWFYWVAPNRRQTSVAVEKLVTGSGDQPPAFPPELVVYHPRTPLVPDQEIRLLDGTTIELHHGFSQGDHLKGKRVYFAVIDEICSIRRPEPYQVTISRLTPVGSQCFVASTPKKGHWARSLILSRARDGSGVVSHHTLRMIDNPWEKPSEIARQIAAAGGPDDPVVRRDFYGEWIGDGLELWGAYQPELHLVHTDDAWTIEALVEDGRLPTGYKDITTQMAAGRWTLHRPREFGVLIGQDFNVDPMTGAVCKVFGDPRDPSTWGLFVVDVVQVRGDVHTYADKLEELYPGVPVSCDSTGAIHGTHPSQGSIGSQTHVLTMQSRGWFAEPCWGRRGNPANPYVADSVSLVNWLFRQNRILVHIRCKAMVSSLDRQEQTRDGRINKRSGHESDELSAPTDAFRYLAWKLFFAEWFDVIRPKQDSPFPS